MKVIALLKQVIIVREWPTLILGVFFGVTLMWSFMVRKTIFISASVGWKFLVWYFVVFELTLSLFKTGALQHHQYYMLPPLFVLVAGAIVQLRLPLAKYVQVLIKAALLGFFVCSVWLRSWSAIGMKGDYFQIQQLYQSLKSTDWPLQTARVIMTDADPERPGGVSNSTELWWFLVTDLGRRDFEANSRMTVHDVAELILVCNTRLSLEHNTTCESQFETVVANMYPSFVFQESIILMEDFLIARYER